MKKLDVKKLQIFLKLHFLKISIFIFLSFFRSSLSTQILSNFNSSFSITTLDGYWAHELSFFDVYVADDTCVNSRWFCVYETVDQLAVVGWYIFTKSLAEP